MTVKFIIIGNSAAGVSAAETLKKIKPSCKISIIGDEPYKAYLRCMLKNVLSQEKDINDIYYKKDAFYDRKGLKTYIGVRATSIVPYEKKVLLENGDSLSYDKLLIATGAAHVPLGIENETSENIFYFRSYDDAKKASHAAKNAKSAVIIGAGPSGIGAAEILNKKGIKTAVIERESHILPNNSDNISSQIIQNNLSQNGISFILSAKPEKFVSDKKGLNSVILDTGDEVPADIALISTGVKPCVSLIKDAGGDADWGIKVDEFLETSISDIFAAGDCIELTDSITKKAFPSAFWHYAVEQGRYAAYNMAGIYRKYAFFLKNMTAANFGKIPFISVGSVDLECESIFFKDGVVFRKFFIKDDRLIGYILTCDIKSAGVYTALIKKQTSLKKLKDKLHNANILWGDLL
jgi:nitrite reductase (NADH) large subunit